MAAPRKPVGRRVGPQKLPAHGRVCVCVSICVRRPYDSTLLAFGELACGQPASELEVIKQEPFGRHKEPWHSDSRREIGRHRRTRGW